MAHYFILFFVISLSCYNVCYFVIVWLRCFFFRRLVMSIYLCGGNSCEQNIFDQIETTNQIIVISMLQNYSHMYSNHNSIIKIVSFESIYYVINPNTISFSMIFSNLVYVFFINVSLILINKMIFFSEKTYKLWSTRNVPS